MRPGEVRITAVPTFVFEEKYAVQGAQPISAFLQALETVAGERTAAGVASEQAVCDPGSCEVPGRRGGDGG